jgi:hypothetical protein
MTGKLSDFTLSDEAIRESLKSIEGLPKPEAKKTGKW